jgi:hypothetical protein
MLPAMASTYVWCYLKAYENHLQPLEQMKIHNPNVTEGISQGNLRQGFMAIWV